MLGQVHVESEQVPVPAHAFGQVFNLMSQKVAGSGHVRDPFRA